MTQTVRCLILAAAVAALAGLAGPGIAPAQKEKPKDTKADKVGTVEVAKDRAGEYRFRVKDADGKVIAMSTKGYDKKEDCLKALEMVKHTLSTAKVTEVKDDGKDDKKDTKK